MFRERGRWNAGPQVSHFPFPGEEQGERKGGKEMVEKTGGESRWDARVHAVGLWELSPSVALLDWRGPQG